MAEFTTMEIAARCNKSERTIQRWIKEGTLPALHIEGNRYEVSEDDLQEHLPHAVVDNLSERIAALESRIAAIEGILAGMSSNKPTRSPRETPSPKAGSTLPDGWIPLTTYCEIHNIAETTARRYLNPEMIKKGTWEYNSSLVKVALDQAGQHHVWNIFSYKTRFKPCDRCPHEPML